MRKHGHTRSPIIAVLDENGEIQWVNQAWKRFGEENGLPADYDSVGTNYLEVAHEADDSYADHAAAGLKAVLDGQASYRLLYPCHSPTTYRWFQLYVTTICLDTSFCLVLHQEVTNECSDNLMPQQKEAPDLPVRELPAESSHLLTYPFDQEESVVTALTEAFEVVGVDIFNRQSTLHEWIAVDAVVTMCEHGMEFSLSAYVYEFLIIFTNDNIHFYRSPADRGTNYTNNR